MICLELVGNDFRYEVENVISLFFPSERLTEQRDNVSMTVVAAVDGLSVCARLEKDGRLCEKSLDAADFGQVEMTLCRALFMLLADYTGLYPKWGIQTGVRPVKLLRSLEHRLGQDGARRYMQNEMMISDDKYRLAKATLDMQSSALGLICDNSFSLYVSIPFCRSRCSYCSFISHDVERSAKLIPEYVENLCREIGHTAEITNALGMKLQTVYFGGGTPTAVSAAQLEKICRKISGCFDMSGVLEYTIEAGRPDTVTDEKLDVIKAAGADRISINPQTLNDEVLKAVHRNHTVAQFYDAYNAARKKGFACINTDLIAGLPADDVRSFEATVDGICEIAPENVTVHTLAMKRSAEIVTEGSAKYDAQGAAVSEMLGYSQKKLISSGYSPYYMYRQSRMSGNNENIGWTVKGKQSLYNIFIMEEIQTVIAVGAGASTKLVRSPDDIRRIFNYKYPYEYNLRFDEMLRRKDEIAQYFAEI